MKPESVSATLPLYDWPSPWLQEPVEQNCVNQIKKETKGAARTCHWLVNEMAARVEEKKTILVNFHIDCYFLFDK